ncbi:zinc-binding dehydrogenase [Actinomadura madurae]|uniref:quinone oxidoreductase family protein n=1 Tax=Actinomadura madurae TaxID=1993 RepID=UPI0020265DF3|nr:zinc-binding dehydrogenase [Actinomadura madurae]URN07726.1 zinc-binding dehydrogenase [Actinomadura madurae]
MRTIRYHKHGAPSVLRVEQGDVPEPGPGEVLIRSEAIGTNFMDTRLRQGLALGAPDTKGTLTGDVVGKVEAVGPEADPHLVGRRVAALVAVDAAADFAVADAEWLVDVPADLSDGAATMLPDLAPVALRTLRTGHLAPSETVLVHAAAGGIGHIAVQLAKLLGAGKVIATAGSSTKVDFARSHGADVAVDYTHPAWTDQVQAAAPGGVDVVLDSVGGEILHRSIDLLAPLGRVVTYGVAGGEYAQVPVASLVRLRTVTGFSIMAWRAAHPTKAREDIEELTALFTSGRLTASVHARIPLDEAPEAHRILDARANLGRVLLVP